MLAGLGRLIHRRRWSGLVLVLLLTVGAGGWGLGVFSKFSQGGFEDPKASSTLVAKLGASYFGSTNPDVLVLYSSDSATVRDPRYMGAVITTVARLPKDRVAEVISYWSFDRRDAAPFASRDQRKTFVSIKLEGRDDATKLANYEAIKDRLAAPGLRVELGGNIPLGKEFGEQVVADIIRAEMITALPLLALLIILFGALVASLLPQVVAIFSIVGGLAVVHAVTYLTSVTSFALEVVTMMGVGLAIDYSLFIVSRFREELARGMDAKGLPQGKPWKRLPTRKERRADKKAYKRALDPVRRDALAITMSTAGRTIVVSGITVSAALGGLLLFPQMFLRTIGLAGIATVLVAVFGAIVVLPILLAVLGPKVEGGRMPWRRPSAKRAQRDPESGFWYRLGHSVMKHPVPYFAVVLVILAVLFGPFLNVQFSSVDARVLPKDSPTRAVVETVKAEFPNGTAEPIDVVVSGDLIPRNWRPGRDGDTIPPYLENFRKRLAELPGVTDAKFTGYSGTYGGVRISVTHRYEPMASQAQELVKRVRAMELTKDGYPMHIDVGGSTAAQMDLMSSLMRTLPMMAIAVGVATFILLFMFFGSVVLPLKAIVMNVLSIGASFGAIVWGFQYGHLAGLLDFTPTGGVEATSMILILAVVFGLSMDYEVFLLSRIREEWDRTHDNRTAVAVGMQRTGSIITSAALLFLVVIGAFSMAGITVVKLIGVGMFVAVVVDAMLVRSLLVPATMRFMGAANWWLPRPLAGLHARMDLRERDDVTPTAPPASKPGPPPVPYAMRWEEPTPSTPPQAKPKPPVRQTRMGPGPAMPTPAMPTPAGPAPMGPGHPARVPVRAAKPRPAGEPLAQSVRSLPQARPSAHGPQPPAQPGPQPSGQGVEGAVAFGGRDFSGDVTFRRADPPPPARDDEGRPWAPWANGQPEPVPQRNSRNKREIVPAPDGSGWRWRDSGE
ncbi:MMPL family transporter [Actinomadura rugatobispora]|uniref:MMPL family transporter n=1 Tax=Actinomadura rugatobispora TaxID=1994 RepID=A0ABW1A313_9ACTN|nr:MMPL family transporter [Actinomadura rugatobispora]